MQWNCEALPSPIGNTGTRLWRAGVIAHTDGEVSLSRRLVCGHGGVGQQRKQRKNQESAAILDVGLPRLR
jgi:hypothetical protein